MNAEQSPFSIGNAAGTCPLYVTVEEMCNSAATRVMVGPVTTQERIGNTPVPPGDVYFYDPVTRESGNSIGLKNRGMNGWVEILLDAIAKIHAVGKEAWVTIVGESPAHIVELVLFCFACGADGVEINLACPNIHDGGKTKPLMCDDPVLMERIFLELLRTGLKGRKLAIKLAPTSDTTLIEEQCTAVINTDIITTVVATNTKGGQRFIRDGVDMIAFKPQGSDEVKHVGGQAGAPIHDHAVWQCREYRRRLPDYVEIIGVGGNFSGRDMHDFIVKAGTSGIQSATAVIELRPKVLGDMAVEFLELTDPVIA